MNAFKPLSSVPHRPRVSVGRMVVSCESWWFRAADLAWATVKSERERCRAARAWRAEQGLPERVVHKSPAEDKPAFADFGSIALVNMLAEIIRKTAKHPEGYRPHEDAARSRGDLAPGPYGSRVHRGTARRGRRHPRPPVPTGELTMTVPTELPEPASALARIRDGLATLPGITGIALGGSRARGVACPDSDIDVGLYYDPATRPDFDLILAAAADLDDQGEPAGHGSYGEWGPWINGGVWLVVDGIKTDILLRDQTRVEKVVRDAAQGMVTTAYQPGHPHGFVSTIYAGEVCHNLSLYDPQGRLADLRALVSPYPDVLLEATVNQFGWEAGFSLDNARSPARRGDLVQVTGLLYRAVVCLNQMVFAHNGRFVLNEKGALAEASGMPRAPRDYQARVEAALTGLSIAPDVLQAAIDSLREIYDELTSWTKNA